MTSAETGAGHFHFLTDALSVTCRFAKSLDSSRGRRWLPIGLTRKSETPPQLTVNADRFQCVKVIGGLA